jgi:hypothetical protein
LAKQNELLQISDRIGDLRDNTLDTLKEKSDEVYDNSIKKEHVNWFTYTPVLSQDTLNLGDALSKMIVLTLKLGHGATFDNDTFIEVYRNGFSEVM